MANRLKNDYSQSPDMWQKIQLIVIKIMSLGYILEMVTRVTLMIWPYSSWVSGTVYQPVLGCVP
ncbi:hypothetical protein [Symbiopectobacterium sp. RP]|uniref:hypothetical protein n=1 Tax=Symbiopectobacterium sp. RP TaxID=3248553 RepID=UPI003D29F03D